MTLTKPVLQQIHQAVLDGSQDLESLQQETGYDLETVSEAIRVLSLQEYLQCPPHYRSDKQRAPIFFALSKSFDLLVTSDQAK